MDTIKKLLGNKMMRLFMGAILFIIVLIIIIMIAVGGKAKAINENTLVNAAKRYLTSNSSLLPVDGISTNVSLTTLISNGYLNSKMEGATCASYVTVSNVKGNYSYIPFIKCGNDSDTLLLGDTLLKNVVTTGDGLYNYNNSYIYRGENPNNYVKLSNKLWRIVGFDKLNNIRIIYRDSDVDHEEWDDRYNTTTDDKNGINDYELSRVKEYLDGLFTSYPEIYTNAVIARLTKTNICVGKVDISSNVVDSCSKTIENAYASIISVNDYVNASLDTSCTTANNKTCQNYNFLNKTSWTISGYSNDTINAYYIHSSNGLSLAKTYFSKSIYPVITLKNNIILVSGTGTKTDPYIVK